jgi:putative Mn2+ efflux pump MntP
LLSTVEILLIAVGLALDAFAVSLGVGVARLANSFRPIFRLSFHFGLFQFLMPVLGWLAGRNVVQAIAQWDHWVALVLLSFVGGRMILSGLRPGETAFSGDPSRGLTLVMLSVATSIDAFAVGLSLAMLQINIWYPSVIIGLITSTLSLFGLLVGHRLGKRFGKKMEVIGGLILICIGVKVVIDHLF